MAENENKLNLDEREKELYALRAKCLTTIQVPMFEDLSDRSKRRNRTILGAANENFRDTISNPSMFYEPNHLRYGPHTHSKPSPEIYIQGKTPGISTSHDDKQEAESWASSPVSSITSNDSSLFYRADKELDAMERMIGTLGEFRGSNDEEEIIFEHDATIANSCDHNVTQLDLVDDPGEIDSRVVFDGAVVDTEATDAILVDVKLYDSPHSQDQESTFQNETSSVADEPFTYMMSQMYRVAKQGLDGISNRHGANSHLSKSESNFSPMMKSPSKGPRRPCMKRWMCGILFCFALVIVFSVGIAGAWLLAIAARQPAEPGEFPSEHEIPEAASLRESLRLLFGSKSGFGNLDDPTKAQNQTLEWLLSTVTTFSNFPELRYDTLMERYVVALLHFALNGEAWDEQNNFLSADHVCKWNGPTIEPSGVFCDSDNRVTHLMLGKNNLKGSLPFEIGSLERLEVLQLYENQIEFQIPTQIGLLQNAKSINLATNSFNGSIPTEIGELEELTYLDFASNQISGAIPSEIGQMMSLRWLSLAQNRLQGGLPSEMGRLELLRTVNLYSNRLGGSIPHQVGRMDLNVLNLRSNEFQGDISAHFCKQQIDSFWADCYGDDALVECSCCTVCCNDEVCCSDTECCSIDENSNCIYGHQEPVPSK